MCFEYLNDEDLLGELDRPKALHSEAPAIFPVSFHVTPPSLPHPLFLEF